MSIQSEINRLAGNVADSLSAVAAKGVTVPAGSTSDDLAGLIAQITGGGGGDGYTRTVVVPQQTFTPNSSKIASLTYTTGFVDAAYYIVTFDGVEWVTTCETLWGTDRIIGSAQVLFGTSDTVYPFAVDHTSSMEVAVKTTEQHTIKVERLEFVDGPIDLIEKTITTNGTYNASSDDADGYSSVTVNVAGGASNVVTGTFKGTTTGAAMDVNIPYTGSGYPLIILIYPTGGVYNAETSFYNLVQRYACCSFTYYKSDVNVAPTYSSTGSSNNRGNVLEIHKSSTSSNTSYGSVTYLGSNGVTVPNGGTPTGNNGGVIVKFKNKNTMAVFIASTSYGFAANIEYTYYIVYSS